VIYLAYAFLILLALVTQAYYTGSEMGLYTVNRFRLRKRQHAGERSARLLAFLLRDPVGLLITFLMGTNVSVYAVTALVTNLYESAGLTPGARSLFTAEMAATATLTLPLFLSEVLTKNFVRRYSERASYLFAWGLAGTKFLLYPLIVVFRPLTALVPGRGGAQRGLGLPRLSKNILHHLLSAGREAGELTVEQERLARNVLQVGNRRVAPLAREISAEMQAAHSEEEQPPAVRTLSVSSAEGAGTVLNRMTAARSRLALVIAPSARAEDAVLTSSDIVGYVRLFDLLEPSAQGKAVGALARPVPRLADHATLRGALTVMQRECADVAVVEISPPKPPRRRGRGRKAPEPSPDAADRPVLGVLRIAQVISELLGAPPPEENEPRPKKAK
jgi:CBS domain containing-hemolysin-like protein